MAISVKTMCLLALLLVLLSQSEVEKTFIADSLPNGSEASRRGTTHNNNNLRVPVECVVRVASLLDINPFIHWNPNISSCFRCIVGYPSFRVQTVISVIYSPKDLFLLFDGSKTSRQTSPLEPTTFNFIQHNIYWERVLLAETRKNCFCKLSCISAGCLGLGRSEGNNIF